MVAHHHNYAALLRRRGFKLTPQRQLIFDVLTEDRGHHTPEEIFQRVHTKSPAVNRATVYRTLELLHKLQLVTLAHGTDNQLVYELAEQPPHHHLVCERCNRVEEIGHEQLAAIFLEIERNYGFSVRSDHLMLFGLCRHCRGDQP